MKNTLLLGAVLAVALPGFGAAADASPEEKKIMDIYMKAAAPGQPHERLSKHAGTWDMVTRLWMKPGAPPMESKGVSERSMELGGRVLVEKVKGENMMGGPEAFEGRGATGFDNVTGKYWNTWTDNMSTSVMASSGVCEPAPGPCVYKGAYPDAVTKKDKLIRMNLRWEGDDKEILEFFEAGKGGKDLKTMEIVSTRRKT